MSADDDKWLWEPVSLCPAAPGWRAVYDSDTEPFWISDPVPLWGIYRQYNFYDRSETGDSDIFGVVPDGSYFERASEAANFWKYLGPGEPDPTPDEAKARRMYWQVLDGEPVAVTITRAEWGSHRWHLAAMSPLIGGLLFIAVSLEPFTPEAMGQVFRTLGLLGIPVPPDAEPFWEQGWDVHRVAEHMTGAKVTVQRSSAGTWFITGQAA